jgi:hypothetical protein
MHLTRHMIGLVSLRTAEFWGGKTCPPPSRESYAPHSMCHFRGHLPIRSTVTGSLAMKPCREMAVARKVRAIKSANKRSKHGVVFHMIGCGNLASQKLGTHRYQVTINSYVACTHTDRPKKVKTKTRNYSGRHRLSLQHRSYDIKAIEANDDKNLLLETK